MSESLVFDVSLEAQPQLRVAGRTWFRRPEFHVTTFTPAALAEVTGLREEELVALGERMRGELTAPRPVRFDGRVAHVWADDGCETLVAFCAVDGLDELYARLSALAGASLPLPPTHVTLYTAEPGMGGIGLPTAKHVARQTKPLAPEEAAAVLASIRPSAPAAGRP